MLKRAHQFLKGKSSLLIIVSIITIICLPSIRGRSFLFKVKHSLRGGGITQRNSIERYKNGIFEDYCFYF